MRPKVILDVIRGTGYDRYEVLNAPIGSPIVPRRTTLNGPVAVNNWNAYFPKGLIDRKWRNTYYAKYSSDDFLSEYQGILTENLASRGLFGDELSETLEYCMDFMKSVLSELNIDSVSGPDVDLLVSVMDESTFEWGPEAVRALEVILGE